MLTIVATLLLEPRGTKQNLRRLRPEQMGLRNIGGHGKWIEEEEEDDLLQFDRLNIEANFLDFSSSNDFKGLISVSP